MVFIKKDRHRMLLVSLVVCLLVGCGSVDSQSISLQTDHDKTQSEDIDVNVTDKEYGALPAFVDSSTTSVEKEELVETYIRDNDLIYADDDETSVVTMYLTVREGNEQDNTNHTWSEINTYSAYDYDDMGQKRYNVEGILQIGDENGPLEGEFGYDATVPNVTVQIRGQTSSRNSQKSYKIRIKDGMGEWRDQGTIALNKHMGDFSRFSNKLCYDLMKDIPQMLSARTQFVHLYVKDQTEGSEGEFVDYGLYTQVEQLNKTYLENHGLDRDGQFYKVNYFEWYLYDEIMASDLDFNEDAFEDYLEIKGNDDNEKLQRMLEAVNDYSIPIEDVIEEYFDVTNITYWMAFHILVGNYDTGARNMYLYSPQNSQKWYFISWDNDSSFKRTYHESKDYTEGQSWEQGLTQFTNMKLINRMLREEEYREALDMAVEDLWANYLTYEIVDGKAQTYANVVKQYIYSYPDAEYARVSQQDYQTYVDAIAYEVERNYKYYKDSLEKPWPFYIDIPREIDGRMQLAWDAAYDLDGEDITYEVTIATDYYFTNVVVKQSGIRLLETTFDMLPCGDYYIRVRARNESGWEQDCFDYTPVSVLGKIYGAKYIAVDEEGNVSEYRYEE